MVEGLSRASKGTKRPVLARSSRLHGRVGLAYPRLASEAEYVRDIRGVRDGNAEMRDCTPNGPERKHPADYIPYSDSDRRKRGERKKGALPRFTQRWQGEG